MTTFTQLTERLDRLEQQNRRLKRGLIGLMLSVPTLLLLVGAGTPGVPSEQGDVTFGDVVAQKVAITDRDGKERLVLTLDAGEPTLTMLNHAGQQQVFLGINENWNDTAYLSVSSHLDNGAVDKQAVLAATASRAAEPGFQREAIPGNTQLILYDRAPRQKDAGGRHLVRLSSGRLDQLKPYLEISESAGGEETRLNYEILMAPPPVPGQRFLLDTTPSKTAVSGVELQ